jgi:hypothetical protein
LVVDGVEPELVGQRSLNSALPLSIRISRTNVLVPANRTNRRWGVRGLDERCDVVGQTKRWPVVGEVGPQDASGTQ